MTLSFGVIILRYCIWLGDIFMNTIWLDNNIDVVILGHQLGGKQN
jgi:hypothetical protein